MEILKLELGTTMILLTPQEVSNLYDCLNLVTDIRHEEKGEISDELFWLAQDLKNKL